MNPKAKNHEWSEEARKLFWGQVGKYEQNCWRDSSAWNECLFCNAVIHDGFGDLLEGEPDCAYCPLCPDIEISRYGICVKHKTFVSQPARDLMTPSQAKARRDYLAKTLIEHGIERPKK